MPIQLVQEDRIEQRCAACAEVRVVPLDQAQALGGVDAAPVVVLPACASCGAIEVLLPSSGKAIGSPMGTYGHLHQLLVDVVRARVVGDTRQEFLEEVSEWFPEGELRLLAHHTLPTGEGAREQNDDSSEAASAS